MSIRFEPGFRKHGLLVSPVLLLAAYLASFFLPVFDNGRLAHMDIRPQGTVLGGSAFVRSGSLLFSLSVPAPDAAAMRQPHLPFLWLALAWLANPLFWIGLACLLWGKNKLASASATFAFFLALNALVALRDESVVRHQEFLSGYYAWLGSMAGLLALALWRAARGSAVEPRSHFRSMLVAGPVYAATLCVAFVAHWSFKTYTRYAPLRNAEDFAAQMRSSDANERLGALNRLAELKGSDADDKIVADTILIALDDPDRRVRDVASIWVKRFPPPSDQAIPKLRRRLEAEDANARAEAPWALLALSGGKAEYEEDENAAWAALAKTLENGARSERIATLDRLSRTKPVPLHMMQAVAGQLKNPDPFTRGLAVRTLQRLEPPGPSLALEALSDPDPDVTRWAVEVAEKLGVDARTHVVPLGKLALKRDVMVGGPAARTLAKIGPEGVPALVNTLGSEDSFVREQGARSLGTMGAAAVPALPELDRLTRDSIPSVAMAAKEATQTIRATLPAKQ